MIESKGANLADDGGIEQEVDRSKVKYMVNAIGMRGAVLCRFRR